MSTGESWIGFLLGFFTDCWSCVIWNRKHDTMVWLDNYIPIRRSLRFSDSSCQTELSTACVIKGFVSSEYRSIYGNSCHWGIGYTCQNELMKGLRQTADKYFHSKEHILWLKKLFKKLNLQGKGCFFLAHQEWQGDFQPTRGTIELLYLWLKLGKNTPWHAPPHFSNTVEVASLLNRMWCFENINMYSFISTNIRLEIMKNILNLLIFDNSQQIIIFLQHNLQEITKTQLPNLR